MTIWSYRCRVRSCANWIDIADQDQNPRRVGISSQTILTVPSVIKMLEQSRRQQR